MKPNINYFLGNFEESHLKIINNYMNYDLDIDWKKISIKEILDDQFIHTYSDKLDWEYLVKYQVLSNIIIKSNIDKIVTNGLLKLLIIYQKIPQDIIRKYIYINNGYWEYLLIHQKLEKKMVRKIMRVICKTRTTDIYFFAKLVAKYQEKMN